MRILILLLSLLLAACAAPPAPTAAEQAKIDTIRAFHMAVMLQFGLPDAEKMAELKPLISTRFANLLDAARAAEDRALARHGGMEPPLIQGSLFHSLFEGAQRIEAIEADPASGPDAYLVTFGYGDPAGPANEIFIWQDRIWLSEEQGRYLVDDIEFLGEWDFSVSGRLSVMLDEISKLE